MKKFLLATILSFLFLGSALAQPQGGSSGSAVANVTVAPTTCTAGVSKPVVYLGTMYQCSAGTYYAVPTTAAGGSITGLTATRVPVAASATTLTDDANFIWDTTNHRLGIGIASPLLPLHVKSASSSVANIESNVGYFTMGFDSLGGYFQPVTASRGFWFYPTTGANGMMGIDANGLVGVGTTSPSTRLTVARAGEGLFTLNNSSSSVPNITIGIGSGSQHSDGYFFFDAASTPSVASQMFVFTYGATASGFGIGKAADTVSSIQAMSTLISLSILDNVAAATAQSGIIIGAMQQGASTITSGTRRSVYINSVGFAPTSGSGVFTQLELATTINQTGGASGITRGIYVNPTLTAAADWRGVDVMATYVNTSGTLVNMNVRSDFNAASSSSATPAGIQSDVRTQGSQNYTSSTGLLGIQSLFTGYGSGTVTWVRGFRAYLDAYQATVTNAAGVYVSSIAASGTGSVGTKYGIYLEAQSGGTTANYSIYSAGGASLLNAGTSTVVPLTLKGAASQSAGLLQTKDSTDAVNFIVTKDGYVAVAGTAPSANAVFTTGAIGGAIGLVNYNSYYGISGFNVYQQYGGWTTFAGINSTELAIGGGIAAQWTGTRFYNSTAFTAGFLNQVFYLASDVTQKWSSTTAANGTADLSLSRISAGVIGVGTGAAGSTAGSMSMTNLTLAGNFFAGPSTIESFTTNASALGTLNYYTDSQTIYYDTAAATADVTINVDASASVDLNTRLATGQMVTVVLAITNTGTPYKCNTLQVHSVGQTIKWVGGSAPTGVANGVDWYTFTIMKTGSSTYYITGSMTTFK